jgi:ceramide glucosyltransferase
MLKTAAVGLSAFATLSSLAFFVLSICGVYSFLKATRKNTRNRGPQSSDSPSVSILKPVKGLDPHMWECFCSHCEQDYSESQLIFGVSDAHDPAIELIQKLKEDYPGRQIDLVICERTLGTNIKVSNLVQMLAAARYPVLLVNDSDICVPHDYLKNVIAKLNDKSVSLVTCLYRGRPGDTLGSRLEALGISTDFVPGVLSARLLENGLRFGLGSTLAFRRSDLDAVGGFESLLDYLADDYELGQRISALGKRVELAEIVVDTFLPPYSLRGFFEHQIRWARTIRDVRRWGYLGVSLTFGVAWALLTVVLAQGAVWAWALFGLTAAARLGVAIISAESVLNDRASTRDLYLLPLRDLIAPIVWGLSFVGNRVRWRGDLFYLKQGRLARVTREVESS